MEESTTNADWISPMLRGLSGLPPTGGPLNTDVQPPQEHPGVALLKYLYGNLMGRPPEGKWFGGTRVSGREQPSLYAEPKYNYEMGEIDAWHGSPHKFAKFAKKAVGSGEGSSAFGWGFYFSDLKDVAKNYVVPKSSLLKEKYGNVWDGVYHAIHGNKLKGIERIENEIKYIKSIPAGPRQTMSPAQKQAVERYEKILGEVKSGKIESNNLYKVKLFKGKDPSEYNFIDWYEPVPKNVVNRIFFVVKNTWKNDPNRKIMGYYSDEADQLLDFLNRNAEHSGQAFYKTLELELNSKKKASTLLNKVGVDGIRYPSGTLTRVKNSKAKNYVVFDENAVTIEGAY